MLKFKNISLRIRIFLSMILLVLLTSILILGVTVYQYDEQTQDYNIQRFKRKEATTKQTIDLELTNKTTYAVNTENLNKIFQERIYEISSINKLNISLYDLNGNLLKSSIASAFEKIDLQPLSKEIITELAQNSNHKILKTSENDGIGYQTSYSYINDQKFKRIAILELQFTQDNSVIENELREFIYRLSLVYLLMFVIAIALAYFLSSYITRSIKSISDKMQQTRLHERNEKIMLNAASSEIEILVEAYNNMIDQLEESAAKLAKSEREQAWREMAKQVAHEIKNPLTPIQLSAERIAKRFKSLNGEKELKIVSSKERVELQESDKAAEVIKEGTDTILREVFSLKSSQLF